MTVTRSNIAGDAPGGTQRQRAMGSEAAGALPGDRPLTGTARKIGTEPTADKAGKTDAPVNGVTSVNAKQPNHDSALAAMVRTKQEAYDKAKKELDDAKALAAK